MCLEAMFGLTRELGAEHIEGLEVFKYLRGMLDQSDYNCPEVLHNIRKAHQVWGWIGKLLRREGSEP